MNQHEKKGFKEVMNAAAKNHFREITDAEKQSLWQILLCAYQDIAEACKKNGLTLILAYGTVLGAVRHGGFIPWDDDLDVALTREDYIKFVKIFEAELGDKYILSAPNYKNNSRGRFPQILIKNTYIREIGADKNSEFNKVKVDLFIIENVPNNRLHRYVKWFLSSAFMFLEICADFYKNRGTDFEQFLCSTPEGMKMFKRRSRIGRFSSLVSVQTWRNKIDKIIQYRKNGSFVSIPTGRRHYLGEIRPRSTYFPVTQGKFEGLEVNLPGNTDDYLKNLYGDYMTLPPEEKKEQHFICEFSASVENVNS